MSRHDTLLNLHKNVLVLYENAKKSSGRGYSLPHISKCRENLNNLEFAVHKVVFYETDQPEYVIKCTDLKDRIIVVLNATKEFLDSFERKLTPGQDVEQRSIQSLVSAESLEPNLIETNNFSAPVGDSATIMAEFDFSIALKLPILDADLSRSKIRDFIDICRSYHDQLNERGKAALLSFLCLNKIQGKAKTRLGGETAATFADFQQSLYNKCGTGETFESLSLKLTTTRQGKMTAAQFSEELELLAAKLTSLSIEKDNVGDQAARLAVGKVFQHQALASFQKGVHSELQTTLLASRPKNMAEALATVTTAKSVASASTSSQNVFFHRRGNYYGNGGNGYRGNGYRGHRYNRGNRGGSWQYQNQNQRNYDYGRGRGYRGQSYRGDTRGNRGYRGGNFQTQNYHEQSQNSNYHNYQNRNPNYRNQTQATSHYQRGNHNNHNNRQTYHYDVAQCDSYNDPKNLVLG